MKTTYVLHECPTTWRAMSSTVNHACYLNTGHHGACRCACGDTAPMIVIPDGTPAEPVDRSDPLTDPPKGCPWSLLIMLAMFAALIIGGALLARWYR